MPNNVKRNVRQIKAREGAHPFSRKAVQLRRALTHGEHRAERTAKRDNARASRLTILFVLQDELRRSLGLNVENANSDDEDSSTDVNTNEKSKSTKTFAPLDAAAVDALVNRVIARNDEMIVQMEAERRRGRPRPPRLQLLTELRDSERQSYARGMFECPDLTIGANVERFAMWDGDVNSLPLIKMTKVAKPRTVAATVRASASNSMDIAR